MERRDWMGLLARAKPATLDGLMSGLRDLPGSDWLRPPETGTVMVRGRTGGVGAPFNLGEVMATRCTLRLACGTEGHAFVQGRDRTHATQAALIDALMQGSRAAQVNAEVLYPLASAETAQRDLVARKAEATRVDFETMVRGEDA